MILLVFFLATATATATPTPTPTPTTTGNANANGNANATAMPPIPIEEIIQRGLVNTDTNACEDRPLIAARNDEVFAQLV